MSQTTGNRPKILGICASLRSGRWAAGGDELREQITAITDEAELNAFLERESLAHLENFVKAGRDDGRPFDEIYKNLKKEIGRKGLSNSEVALSAALWAANQLDCDIDFVSLVEHFPPSGDRVRIDELKERLLEADGLLLATPVYFGDRSSLAHDFISLFHDDPDFAEAMKGRVYGGLAVGAKRNGGQETTLIYQILDMVNAGMLAVGNDSDTTSQYGGTVHAGDVGTAWKDTYGLDTSRGAGRRIARVAHKLRMSNSAEMAAPLKVAFWVLQDRDDYCIEQVRRLAEKMGPSVEASIIAASDAKVTRCLACDICPTKVGHDREYRCIIKKKDDFFAMEHEQVIDADAIVPVALATQDRSGLDSKYQQFIERTRYLRRGDYVFTDLLTAPLIFQEVGVNDSLQLRMLTSALRHHTVMATPMIGFIHNGEVLNLPQVDAAWESFVTNAQRMTAGRLLQASAEIEAIHYKPVGYILSAEKDKEPQVADLRKQLAEQRLIDARHAADVRLKILENQT